MVKPTKAARKTKAPRKASIKADEIQETPPPLRTLVLDNGGDNVRYGWVHHHSTQSDGSAASTPQSIPNMTARLPQQWTIPVGDQILALQNPNLAVITRSTERGIIHNMGNQVQVWKRILDLLQVSVPPQSDAATVYGWKPNPAAVVASSQCAVLIGLAPFTPRSVLDQIVYVWMEDLGCSHVGFYVSSVAAARPSLLPGAGPDAINSNGEEEHEVPIACVVDLGWSATQCISVYGGTKVLAHRRVPLGGQHLLHLLRYYITYRQWNLMDQLFVLRHVLESTAMVALDFDACMQTALRVPAGRRTWDRNYVLPDYDTTHQGEVQIPLSVQRELDKQANGEDEDNDDDEDSEDEDYEDKDMKDEEEEDDDIIPDTVMEPVDVSDDEEDEEALKGRLLEQRREEELRRRQLEESQQVLRISTERFAIPEVLFRPQDAGLPPEWAGVPEAIVQTIQSSPEMFRPALYLSIQVVGGLSQMPGLRERLEREVRSLAPTEYDIRITLSNDPTMGAWYGAYDMVRTKPYREWSVGRDEWMSSNKRGAWKRLTVSEGGIYM